MQSRLRIIVASDNYGRDEPLVNRIWWRFLGASVALLSASQVQLQVVGRVFLFVKCCALFIGEALRKHCATIACMVIKLVLRVHANRM
jgi:hypothetical protein